MKTWIFVIFLFSQSLAFANNTNSCAEGNDETYPWTDNGCNTAISKKTPELSVHALYVYSRCHKQPHS